MQSGVRDLISVHCKHMSNKQYFRMAHLSRMRAAALDFVQMIFASVDACATPAREKSWHLPFAPEARHHAGAARPA
jgi:hypothetical protein